MLDQIREIICNYVEIDPDLITMDTTVLGLGLTSFDVINIIAECETAFGIAIPERDIKLLVTVGDMIAYIETECGCKKT